MKIQVNGEYREVEGVSKLSDLLKKLGVEQKGIAIELNRQVIARDLWLETLLCEGDSLEIVQFVGGG